MKLANPVPGRPCWVELSTSDVHAARAFYATLLGWRSETDPRPEAGGYTMARIGEDAVAAFSPLYRQEQRAAWTVSFATADADASADAVRSAGGTVLMGPMDVFDLGRFVVAADPAGAVFSVWQARAFPGAERFGEQGTLGWAELRTPDPKGALAFYPAVLGWTVNATGHFTHWGVGGTDFGGMKEHTGEPTRTPPHWLPYFTVADTEATAATALASGGTPLAPPRQVPGGPWVATLRDPQGADFGIRTP
ncbi:VOC family protein [Streptomyces sp. NPDC005752]|uniref:VOC family protein n=1 Tax=Streptomyces sp. NPDC005752 TaxID=3157065 RepID=UPI0033E6087A